MSKISNETEKRISIAFQNRLIDLISDDESSKSEFAALVGVSKDVINRAVIYGIIPSLLSLIKIADYLEVSLSYLLNETNDNNFYKPENPSTFHIRIEKLREEKKTKYSKIARTMPFPENYFYNWLRLSTLPSLEYLKAIANYFEVSLDYLLGRTEDRE